MGKLMSKISWPKMYKLVRGYAVQARTGETGTFCGVDLSEWTYLGTSRIGYSNASTHSWVHLFAEKDNEVEGKRKFVHVGESAAYMKDHSWMVITLEQWLNHEMEWFQCVNTEPSIWAKDWMLAHYKHVWNADTKWWVKATEAQKYEGAKKEQKKESAKAVAEESSEDNVVIAFPKKTDD